MTELSLLAEPLVGDPSTDAGLRDRVSAESRAVVTASAADLAEFRAYRTIVKDYRQSLLGRLRNIAGRQLSFPLAISHGLRGVCRYGSGVKTQYGVSLAKQFRYLCADNRSYRILPENFYMYQLYLAENRKQRARHFAFSDILPMQQYLIDVMGCQDFPFLRSKHRFAQRCHEVDLPSVPVLAEFAEGEMVNQSPEIAALPPADLFSKPSELWCGIGANLWRHQSGEYTNALSGEKHDQNSLVAKLCAESKSGKIVLQARIANHSSIAESLTSGGLATVRLVTCRAPSGEIDFMPPALRMPVGRAIVDNIAQGGLAAPIDLATGKICGPAIQKSKAIGIAKFKEHPDTGVKFIGVQLPLWKEVIDLARHAHRAFPSMPFVGWDIAILPEGPVLLEGNSWWDIDLTLLPHRISLSDTQFIPYYNYHLRSATENPVRSLAN